MSRAAVFLLLLLVSVSAPAAGPSPKELEEAIGTIEQKISAFVANNCTAQRKQLCLAMKGFLNGRDAPSFSRAYYVGRLHSIQSNFKSTLDYPHTNALLLVSKTGPDTSVRFEQVEPESAEEETDVRAAVASIAGGKEPEDSSFTNFVKRLIRAGGFSTCQIVKTTHVCTNMGANHQLVMLRERDGNLYAIVPGMVPFMRQSFDQVPGFFLSEFVVGHK